MRPIYLSLGSKLAATTTLVVGLVSAVLVAQISGHERDRLIASKQAAAAMVAQLMATSLSATVEFGDASDLEAQLNNLRTNPDISGAAVWRSQETAAAAGWQRSAE